MRTGTDAELQRLIDLAKGGDERARENLLHRLTDLDGAGRKTLLQRIIDRALSEDGKAPDALLKLVIDLANKGDASARDVLFTLVWNRLRACRRRYSRRFFLTTTACAVGSRATTFARKPCSVCYGPCPIQK